jgi:hypothetical protein
MSKIKKLEDVAFLSYEKQRRLVGGRSCSDRGLTCTGGGLPPAPAPVPTGKPPIAFCNCNACFGEEANFFAAGLSLSTR